ncbi:unnamed protein product [Caenorhabditis angaria]|uniref:Uncharacterized protein n=1 Tax=Caenorhabditis angaria TaxID=860376 RepID=A0A9P1N7A1_9PELO|nr:unnamed protein product [Caenorhabditis angaria]
MPTPTSLLLIFLISTISCFPSHQGYESKYGSNHKSSEHGDFLGEHQGYGSHYDEQAKKSDDGANGYYEGKYGESGKKVGKEEYTAGDENGHKDEEHEKSARKYGDGFGFKKFSYFSSGSGPAGSYQKGYYGHEDYEHDDKKTKYSMNAEDDGFKKGYNGDGKYYDDQYNNYDKESDAHKKHHSDYDRANHGAKYGGASKKSHSEGWRNEKDEYDSKYGH